MSVPRAVFHLPPARSAFPRRRRAPAPEARSLRMRAGGRSCFRPNDISTFHAPAEHMLGGRGGAQRRGGRHPQCRSTRRAAPSAIRSRWVARISPTATPGRVARRTTAGCSRFRGTGRRPSSIWATPGRLRRGLTRPSRPRIHRACGTCDRLRPSARATRSPPGRRLRAGCPCRTGLAGTRRPHRRRCGSDRRRRP